MARIAGVDLPNKAVKIALTYIYGSAESLQLRFARRPTSTLTRG